ncbi:MAG TPA: ABC transporter substrate-binding protein [Chloroflexota bacterium]|nr:ABC transporter substrate-binding protein [Chloroflexota bacterium]
MARMPRAHVGLAVLTGLAIALAGCSKAPPAPGGTQGGQSGGAPSAASAPPVVAPPLASQASAGQAAGPAGDLSTCPPRTPVLRVGGVFASENFSPHPMETRFSSTHYTRLYGTPLFGADPLETKVDPAYGAAESWEFSDDATLLRVRLHDGLTYNNGEPITAEDVAFSLELAGSDFADPQLTGIIRAFGATAEAQNDRELLIHFKEGAVTFPTELSPLVYPFYVVPKKHHSNGAITQQAFDAFREQPVFAGPYEIVSREVQRSMILKAARRDPLLGCPTYDRVEIYNIPETGTRLAQFQTGQLDLAEGNRDLIEQAKGMGAKIASKPAANIIGLYFFQTYSPTNILKDVRLRQAATYAIDHQTLGKTIWLNEGIQSWGCTWPPPTEISMEDPAYVAACGTPYPYDPDKARQLLADAGYGPNNRPKIKLVFWGNYPEESDLAQAMQPMLNAVGFDTQIERVERAEWERRRWIEGALDNSIMFFGPGGRATSLAGSYSVYGPNQGIGPKDDADVVAALSRAASANTEKEYVQATIDLGKLVHDRAYGPGFFAAGSIWFLRSNVPDWGLGQSKGRGPLNLSALATKRS